MLTCLVAFSPTIPLPPPYIPAPTPAAGHLHVRANDIVVVRQKASGGWWLGESNGQVGWFPQRYCVEMD